MDLLCGNLYVSKQHRNQALDAFERRYFVLYPYCGLQWFLVEPAGIVDQNLFEIAGKFDDVHTNARGWIFGGNISVNEISVNETIDSFDEELDVTYFPFTLHLVCDQIQTTVKLATDNIESMNLWIERIKNTCANINLIKCFASHNCFPNPVVYSRGLSENALQLKNQKLENSSLESLSAMASSNGDQLTLISLCNCQIRDNHIASVAKFIDPGLLLHLSLADNFITDVGAKELSVCLIPCQKLQVFDISANFVGDDGMEQLVSVLGMCPQLHTFIASRNHLTERSVRVLAKHLAKFSSKLTHLDVSYNQLGDGAASLGALLLQTPSQLRHLDISFCGVGETGMKSLIAPLKSCTSLKLLNIKGSFAGSAVFTPLLEAVASHHRKTSQLPKQSKIDDPNAGLILQMGSLMLRTDMLESMSYKTAKSAFPYVDNATLLVDACVRRKLANIHNPEFASNRDPSTSAVCIISLRFEETDTIETAEDLVDHLSVALNASPLQFRILSCSADERDVDGITAESREDIEVTSDSRQQWNMKTNACLLTLLFQDATAEQQRLHKTRLFPRQAGRSSAETLQGLLCLAGSEASDLANVQIVCGMLQRWASASAPVLRSLGIRTVFIQRYKMTLHQDITATVTSVITGSLQQEGAPIHCNISKSSILGRGGLDEFVPALSPADYSKVVESASSANANMGNNSNEIQLSYNDELWRRLALNEDGVARKYMKDVGALIFGDADDSDDESEAYSALLMRKSRDHAVARLAARRERKIKSTELIQAVRDLRRLNQFDSSTAKFWEGALGNVRYRDNLLAIQLMATSENGQFRGVSARTALCSAMEARDISALEEAVSHCEANALHGGLTLVLARRLLSELLHLLNLWKYIGSLGDNYDYLFAVEAFLGECGRLAYRGSEMFAAVDLRKSLLLKWNAERPAEAVDHIEVIKRRALLSNLMISRDYESLEREYDEIRGIRDDVYSSLPEIQIARSLLLERAVAQKRLKKTVDLPLSTLGVLEAAEEALAGAVYSGITGEGVDKAKALVASAATDPARALRPLLRSLRNSNQDGAYAALAELHRLGWVDPVLSTDVVFLIFARLTQRTQEETCRNALLKTSAMIVGGFNVNSMEAARTLQRARALPALRDNPHLRRDFEVIEKKVKRVMYPFQQETEILRQIEACEVESLEVLLSGKGTGKLVVNAPTAELLKTWMERLQRVCNEPILDHGNATDEGDIIMAGTMEKAARSDTGTLRGWRRRYFILQGHMLTYYTSAGGEKKGTVRVKGGSLRVMNPAECGGRLHCIELQEGRDLSILDPELLNRARDTMTRAKAAELEKSLIAAIESDDLATVATLTDKARSLHLRLDFQVSMVAETLARSHNVIVVKNALLDALAHTPKAQLEQPLRRAEACRLDPCDPLLLRLRTMLMSSELAVALFRAQNCLGGPSSGLALGAYEAPQFRRLFNYLARYDMKRFTSADRRLLIALMIQYSGMAFLSANMTGESMAAVTRLVKHALTCCSHFHTETEALQLGRLCVGLAGRALGGDVGEADLVVRGEKRQDFTVFLEDFRLAGQLNPVYSIDKYSLLHLAAEANQGGLLSSLMRRPSITATRGTSDAVALLGFTSASITKSLLRPLSKESKEKEGAKQEKDAVSQQEICRLFDALQVVMGDRPLSSLQSSKSAFKTSLITGKHADIVDVAMELIRAGLKHRNVGDELYVQVVKQLSGNPSTMSVIRGWSLLSLYLHYFAPSQHFLPFLQNFVGTCLKKLSANDFEVHEMLSSPSPSSAGAGIGSASGNTAVDDETGLSPVQVQVQRGLRMLRVINLTQYCLQLLSVHEMSYRMANSSLPQHSVSAPLSSTSNPGSVFQPQPLERDDVAYALDAQNSNSDGIQASGHSVDVTLLTGSQFSLQLRYGEVTGPLSLLQLAYMKYSGQPLSHLLGLLRAKQNRIAGSPSEGQDNSADNDGLGLGDAALLRAHFSSIFRGFGLYFHVGVSPTNDAERDMQEEDEEEKQQDLQLQQIPVQPEERQFIDFKYDLLWDIMGVAREVARHHVPATDLAAAGAGDGEDEPSAAPAAAPSLSCGTFVVRRRAVSSLEQSADQLELFGEQVAVSDGQGLKSLWETWLGKAHGPLPLDHARLDLQFAEDTRYVNSGLYGSGPHVTYLQGLQLALSWEDEEPSDWGEGHAAVLTGTDLSLRPMHKFPLSLDIGEAVDGSIDGDHAVAMAGGSRLSLSAEQFRKSVYQHQEHQERLRHLRASTAGALESVESSRDGRDRDGEDLDEESESPNVPEESEESDSNGEVSLYSSVDYDEHTDPDLDLKPPRLPIRSYDSLGEEDIEVLQNKLRLAGCEQWEDESYVREVIETVINVHKLAVDLGIPTSAPRYRYLVKRTYLEYTRSLPLFGAHFAMGRFAKAEFAESASNLEMLLPGAPVPVLPSVPLGQHVLIALNCAGVLLLDPDTWSIIMQAPLFDLEGVGSAPLLSTVNDEDECEYDSTLILNVNGMELSIETCNASELQSIAEACVCLSLASGSFPCGTLWANFHATHGLDALAHARLAMWSFCSTTPSPLIPAAPVPPTLIRSELYFAPPKSIREVLAEERLKEELLEEAVAKLAAEAQAEKNQLKLEEGRHAVQRFDTDNNSDGSDDERGSRKKKDKDKDSKRRQTKRRDNLTRMTMGVNAEQVLRMQITAGVCGVPTRKSRIAHVPPEPPQRRAGKLRLDTYDRVRVDEAPVLSAGNAGAARASFRSLRPVSTLWPSIHSPALESVKKQMPYSDFPSVRSHHGHGAGAGALYLTSSGQFALRSTAVAEEESRLAQAAATISSWSPAVMQFAERHASLIEQLREGLETLEQGRDADTSITWNGLTINSYMPCMGVYGHIKTNKKKKAGGTGDFAGEMLQNQGDMDQENVSNFEL